MWPAAALLWAFSPPPDESFRIMIKPMGAPWTALRLERRGDVCLLHSSVAPEHGIGMDPWLDRTQRLPIDRCKGFFADVTAAGFWTVSYPVTTLDGTAWIFEGLRPPQDYHRAVFGAPAAYWQTVVPAPYVRLLEWAPSDVAAYF